MTKKLIPSAASFFFVAGLASVVYGLWLWSHPLAFVLGGLSVAAIAFFLGYPDLAKERGR